jgi:NADPH-dependent F420 reductase
MTSCLRIGIIGATGALGSGLARRLSMAGHTLFLGSRDPARARALAGALPGPGSAEGATYANAAAASEILCLCVPFAAQQEALDAIAGHCDGRILIDATVPLVPPKVMRVQLPPEGSSAARVQARLGPTVTVVSALQNVGARHLAEDAHAIDCDVLVCADDVSARAMVIDLLGTIGLRGIHAGPLQNAAAAEALTSVLIFINRHYGSDRAGVRVTGIPGPA